MAERSAVPTGAALVEQALHDLAREDGLSSTRPAAWDPNLAELSTVARTRIPPIVEERCKAARHRSNCGLIAAARHAWASADNLLHLWDYRRENPEVVVLPADSAIVTVAACPPRPGIFGAAVELLLVLCTRCTVSLVGLQLPRDTLPMPEAQQVVPAKGQPAPAKSQAMSQAMVPMGAGDGLRLVALEGYAARTDGALFHCIAHTDDGHILLSCGTPQLFELAYSRAPSWFHSKCRLVQHAMGMRARVRGLFALTPNIPGRVRLLACAPHDYVLAADDASTLRLYGLDEHSVHRGESVAVVRELAVLPIAELSQQLFASRGAHLASSTITHIFPDLGLDGHVHAHIVTAASERLLVLCSRNAGEGGVQHGFWLQYANESRLGHGGGGSTTPRPAVAWAGSAGFRALTGAAPARRLTCLEETVDPCAFAAGIWVAASHRPGVAVTELGISVRVGEEAVEGSRSLYTSLTLDSPVLDIAEEGSSGVGKRRRVLESGDIAFCGARFFALLLQHSVQVLRVSFKPESSSRPPATAADCCRHLVSLASPASAQEERACRWSFSDVGVPAFDEQRQAAADSRPLPPVLGKWLTGLLRFLALVLRPAWSTPLVAAPAVWQQLPSHRRWQGEVLGLALEEETVQRLLARLRPALKFAQEGLESSAESGSAGASPFSPMAPASAAVRARLYTHERNAASESAAQAQRALRGVLEVAERAQQVLGLVSVLHSQKSAYRVLQSSVMVGSALEGLKREPLSNLVATPDALAPVVQLCTALVAESGLATPAGGVVFDAKGCPQTLVKGNNQPLVQGPAADLCRELEEQCPAIFAQVDLGYMKSRLSGVGTKRELLRSHAQCISVASQEEQWATLAQSVRALAAEDARAAADVCVEKLQQMPAAGLQRAQQLLEALLGAVARPPPHRTQAEHVSATRALVEHLLVKTASLPAAVHTAVLEYMLLNAQLHKVLEALVMSPAADVQGFLQERCSSSHAAGELLWRHHLAQGQPALASGVLLQMAERADEDCGLAERTQCLDAALQAARRALPQSQALAEKLQAQLDVAARVQAPLLRELRLLASDKRVAARWREAAEERARALRRLLGLRELYQTAVDFSFFHLALLVADLSSDVPEREQIANTWVGTFFPPVGSPYALPGTQFPLLSVRCSLVFLLQDDGPPPAPSEDLRARASRLVEELAAAAREQSAIFDAHCIVALLEYCSCLWLKGGTSTAEGRCWVALGVLARRPFRLPRLSVLRLYSSMVSQLRSWLRDLQALLPSGAGRVDEAALRAHLGEVALEVGEPLRGAEARTLLDAVRGHTNEGRLEPPSRSTAMDSALVRTLEAAPLRGREGLDAAPSRGTDAVLSRGVDSAPPWGLEAAPLRSREGLDAAPSRGTDMVLSRGADSAPLWGVDAAPLRGADAAFPRALDTLPLRATDAPTRSSDAAPARSADTAPLRTVDTSRGVDAPPRAADAAPLRSPDIGPLKGVDGAPLRSADVPPRAADVSRA